MNKRKTVCLLLCAAMALCGCSAAENTVATVYPEEPDQTAQLQTNTAVELTQDSVFSSRDMDAAYSEEACIPIVLEGNGILCDSDAVDISGTTATIRKEGTYLITGSLEDGSMIVDAEKTEKIQLVLKDASIHSETSAAIYVRQADKVFVTLAENTENRLSGGENFVPDEDNNVDAVIFSKDDLTLNGSGALTISSPGGHGIVSKDSLRITGGSYGIEAAEHGLSGKDEVSIAAGSFEITAGKDGIHAENEDDPEGGFVYLSGGSFRVTSEGDGISASGQCMILDGEFTITSGGGSENAAKSASGQDFFGGQWGGRESGGEKPSGGDRTSGGAPGDPSEPPQNSRNNGGKGSGGQGRGDAPAGAIPPGEEDDSVSTKGIKAANLTVYGGTFRLDCADDGLHANEDLAIWNGNLQIASGDDGIHADGTVTVAEGTIEITNSYEGIEGLNILISGGSITLAAVDDGLNAAGGMDASGFGRRGDTFGQSGSGSSVVITGGTVNITASGDGIDANGGLEIAGGFVTVCGPTKGDTSVLDYDTSGIISGGTFLGTGSSSMAQTFSGGDQGVISVNAGNCSAGTKITLTDSSGKLLLTLTPELDFSLVILSSPEIQKEESYTLDIGGNTGTYTAK